MKYNRYLSMSLIRFITFVKVSLCGLQAQYNNYKQNTQYKLNNK